MKNILQLWLLTVALLLAGQVQVFGQDFGQDLVGTGSPEPGFLGFSDCVTLALTQSPQLIKSELEIEVRRLDESDSFAEFLPTFSVKVQHHFAEGTALSLESGSYNPVSAYYSLEARELITKIAELTHLKLIDKGIYELAKVFLQLDHLEKMFSLQEQIVGFAQQRLTLAKDRQQSGSVSLLAVKIAEQEVTRAEVEGEAIRFLSHSVKNKIRIMLGTAGVKNEFDSKEARKQVLKEFDQASVGLTEFKAHSFEFKIHELSRELLGWNVTKAYLGYMPTFSFGSRKPDILDSNNSDDEYSTYISVKIPIWEGRKTKRDITRQKLKLQQYDAEISIKRNQLEQGWFAAQAGVLQAAVALKLAESVEELARLRVKQGSLERGLSVQAVLSRFDNRINLVRAAKEQVTRKLEYDQAVLAIRYLSGELFRDQVKLSGLQR